MNKQFFILTGAFFCLFISCNKTQNNEGKNSELRELRTEFTTGKSSEEVKSSFHSVSFDTKQKLWIDKMNHLLEQDFNNEIKKNIRILKDFIENFGDKDRYEKFNDAVIQLAKMIPSEDFSLMFESLNDYDYSGNFVGKMMMPEEFITNITNLKTSYRIGGLSDAKVAKFACRCRWCWIEEVAGETTSNCNESHFGCGFLWLQRCNKRGTS